MMAEQDNDETHACGLWLYMTRMLSVRYAMVVVSLSGLVYMLRGNRECVGVLVSSSTPCTVPPDPRNRNLEPVTDM